MKRKLTTAEKAERKRRKALFTTIFVGGKMKRVRRIDPLVEGIPYREFVSQHGNVADLIEHGIWEYVPTMEAKADSSIDADDDDIPF